MKRESKGEDSNEVHYPSHSFQLEEKKPRPIKLRFESHTVHPSPTRVQSALVTKGKNVEQQLRKSKRSVEGEHALQREKV